jgi:hypothetical protein
MIVRRCSKSVGLWEKIYSSLCPTPENHMIGEGVVNCNPVTDPFIIKRQCETPIMHNIHNKEKP